MSGDSTLGLGSLQRDRDHAERRYVAALEALDAAAALPPVLTSSVAATEADIVRIDRIWNQGASGGGAFRRRI